MHIRSALRAALLLSVAGLAGCTTSPTSGRSIFTGLVSEQQEAQLGASEHQKILAQFGGVDDNKAMHDMVQRIGARLTPHAERQNVAWNFTVLNSDVVNAFAVPGGYIYITRGLLNLAQDESQVASVLAHEMAHINARHSAQQMSQSMLANLGLTVLGAATGSNAAAQAGSVGADLFIKGYSREHEFESDDLSVRYLAAAGYDPYAATKFLAMLQSHTELQARMAGQPANAELFSYFSTHPQTPQRVARARTMADQAPKIANPIINRDGYLRAVDGTVYGDSADQGIIRGQEFLHPVLGIRFTAPHGFKLVNSPQQVIAENGSGAAMVFDMGNAATNTNDPASYITGTWVPGAPLSQQERLTVNGFAAATATARLQTNKGQKDVRLVAISAGNGRFYRLNFVTPVGQMDRFAPDFLKATHSFARMTDREKQLAQPNRVRLIKVQSGDTVQSLASKMAVQDFAVERFCLLNGISPDTRLQVGQVVKTVQPF